MKNLIFTIILSAFAAMYVFSQNCSQFQTGMKMNITVSAYLSTAPFYPEWAKLKDSKKEEKVIEYNKNVLSGVEKPVSGGTYEFLIKDVNRDNTGERILVESDIAGTKYSTVMACKDDIMYLSRTAGPVWAIDKGDTVGFTLMGIQELPNKMKVGDKLKPYDDVSFFLPSKSEISKTWPEFQGYQTSVRIETGLSFDLKSSSWAYGDWKITETKAIYENIDVKGKEVFKTLYNVKHYLNAFVTGTEEIKIDGKTYTAFIIESETWSKFKIDVSYDMENSKCEAYYNKIMKKADDKNTKKNVKSGVVNDEGYSVTYLTEWFVPGIGVVKAEGHDMNGFINLLTSTQSVK